MNIRNRRKAHALLIQAGDKPISENEQALLNSYLQTDEGRLYASFQQQLSTRSSQKDSWLVDKQQLFEVTRKIDQEVHRRRRKRHIMRTGQSLAAATAVFLLIFVVYLLFQRPGFTAEPAASDTAVNALTPTPPYGMEPVDLYTHLAGDLSVLDEETAVGFPLHLPTWTLSNLEYKEMAINSENDSVELYAVQKYYDASISTIWILAQAELTPETVGKPLPLNIDPLAFSKWDVSHSKELADQRTIEPGHSEITSVNGNPATFQQEKWKYDEEMVTFVNILSWEEDGKRFTFAIMGPTAAFHAETLVGLIQNMRFEKR